MTHLPMDHSAGTPRRPSILGIWRLGDPIHRSDLAEIARAQPADATGSPRWDYVIKRAIDASENVESRRQIANCVAAANASSHPNLIVALDASVSGENPFVVMPKIDGEPMQRHLDHGPPIPLAVALWWVRQMAQGLSALHAGGWVHGDVKPANAIVGPRGHVTLIDLGFATRTHTAANGQFRGTPDYASPELLQGEMAAMPSMDVFSLGRVLSRWVARTELVSRATMLPVVELTEQMISPNPFQRPNIDQVIRGLLKLEIDTLSSHIGPAMAVRRAA